MLAVDTRGAANPLPALLQQRLFALMSALGQVLPAAIPPSPASTSPVVLPPPVSQQARLVHTSAPIKDIASGDLLADTLKQGGHPVAASSSAQAVAAMTENPVSATPISLKPDSQSQTTRPGTVPSPWQEATAATAKPMPGNPTFSGTVAATALHAAALLRHSMPPSNGVLPGPSGLGAVLASPPADASAPQRTAGAIFALTAGESHVTQRHQRVATVPIPADETHFISDRTGRYILDDLPMVIPGRLKDDAALVSSKRLGVTVPGRMGSVGPGLELSVSARPLAITPGSTGTELRTADHRRLTSWLPGLTGVPNAPDALLPGSAVSARPVGALPGITGENIMQGIEQSLPVTRLMPIGDSVPVRIAAPLARDLGLREGQVIQAVVEGEAGNLRLMLNERPLTLPAGHGLSAGDQPLLKVVNTPNGLLLQRVDTAGATAPPSTPHPAPTLPMPSASVMALLARSQDGAGLLRLFSSLWHADTAAAAAVGSGPLREALAMLERARPAMATLLPSELRAAIAASGLFAEAALASRRPLAEADAKTALRRLLRTAAQPAQIQEIAEQAVQDLEAAQVQAVQARAQGELLLNITIPFADAPPVRMRLERKAPRRDELHPPFVANLHSQTKELGELWLNVSIFRDAPRIGAVTPVADLTMWATRPGVSEAARDGADALGRELAKSGIQLRSFAAYYGERPSESPRDTSPPGSIVNLDA